MIATYAITVQLREPLDIPGGVVTSLIVTRVRIRARFSETKRYIGTRVNMARK